MNPLDYARKGLKEPDQRSRLERKLDRIIGLVVFVILGTFAGLFILFVTFVWFGGS